MQLPHVTQETNKQTTQNVGALPPPLTCNCHPLFTNIPHNFDQLGWGGVSHHHYRHRHHHYRHLDQSDLLAGVSYLNWFTCNPSRLLSGRLSKAPARRYFISAAPENISQRKVTKGKIFILMPPSTSIALCFICPTPLIANASDQTIIKMTRTSEW